MKDARLVLAENLTVLMSESAWKSQNSLSKVANVGQTTIGNILRSKDDPSLPYPRLDIIESLAKTFRISCGELLSENLGRKRSEPAGHTSTETIPTLSPQASRLITRLAELERAHHSPPALYALIENALDLIEPPARGSDYAGLDDLAE